ncbi:DNA repair protein REV1 isoform X1 [Schistocerca nitens]|uniref:DNA repair protein REV1 isoform X1 n=2 Tax=Schistocerca nitens TaxID=7011 RepID=UPI002119B4F8|nr:DNA repair protein REV1 isoform X1 [Schistocerca nitens]
MIKKKRPVEDNGFASWGGYMEAKKSKLLEQFKDESKKLKGTTSDIFRGVSIYVNGYTKPSADELKRIMAMYGGEYHQYESHRTTHIIASNLPDCKIKKLKVLNVVKPEWITDSIKAKKLLDYRMYLLYSKQSKTQPALNFLPNQHSSESNSLCENSVDENLAEDTTRGDYEKNKINKDDLNSNRSNFLTETHTNGNFCNESELTGESATSVHYATTNDLPVLNNPIPATGKDIYVETKEKGELSLPDNRRITRTAVDSEFLSEFYNNSRLHHISTMGALFKQYICKLREESNKSYPGRMKLKNLKKNGLKLPAECSLPVNETLFDNMNDDELLAEEGSLADENMKYKKIIMHIDMDCFFVSVGLRNRPELRTHPVAVTHAKGNPRNGPQNNSSRKFEFAYYKERKEQKFKQSKNSNEVNNNPVVEKGTDAADSDDNMWYDNIGDGDSMSEIASCNYEARKAGVCNGMFLGSALKVCPNLKTIPYDFEGYKEVSYTLYNTVASYTLNIEAVSCDEMYVDCTDIVNEMNITPLEFADVLRREIKEKTGCPASAGFGPNPLMARLATKKAKPDGQYFIEPSRVLEFVQDIKVDDLPGVGYTLSHRLRAMGIRTCGDLQTQSLANLKSEFGVKTGETLYNHCRGIDNRELDTEHKRKSVSAEVNYGIRFTKLEEAEKFLKQLSNEVAIRLQSTGMKGRCVTLKLLIRANEAPVETAKFMGHGVCDHVTRSSTVPIPVDGGDAIAKEVLNIFRQIQAKPNDLRGVGIQISRLQKSLGSKSVEISKFLAPKSTSKNSINDCRKQISINDSKPNKNVSVVGSPNLNEENVMQESLKDCVCKRAVTDVPGGKIDTYFKEKSKGSIIRSSPEICSTPSSMLSNVDKNVLAELPEDIQQEILMYSRHVTDAKTKDKHLVSPKHSAEGKLKDLSVNEEVYQVDPNFLSALPDDVRMEIEEDLKYQKCRQQKIDLVIHPVKGNNDSGKSTDRVLPVPDSIAHIEGGFSDENQNTHNLLLKSEMAQKTSLEKEAESDEEKQQISHETKWDIFDVTLNVNELRTLIREWVATEREPKSIDIRLFTDLLCQMVKEKNIETVDLLFRCLYRCVSRKKNCMWQNAYLGILKGVQKVIIEIYKVKLKLPKDFLCEDGCTNKSNNLS